MLTAYCWVIRTQPLYLLKLFLLYWFKVGLVQRYLEGQIFCHAAMRLCDGMPEGSQMVLTLIIFRLHFELLYAIKINLPKFRFIKSLRHAAILNFSANFAWCVKRQNIAGLCQQTFYFCSADVFS